MDQSDDEFPAVARETARVARAHCHDVLDSVHLDLSDESRFAFTGEQGRNMGF